MLKNIDSSYVSKKEKFYSGLVYILVVAIIMTLFELIFFTLIICPKETQIIEEFVKNNKLFNVESNIVNPLIDPLISKLFGFGNDSNDFINVLIIRENNLISQINLHLILFIGTEILFMISLLGCIYRRIRLAHTIGNLILAIKTVVILCFFQLNMYFFAQEFLYTTKEELQLLIYDRILENI
jgi:hypothetical protein